MQLVLKKMVIEIGLFRSLIRNIASDFGPKSQWRWHGQSWFDLENRTLRWKSSQSLIIKITLDFIFSLVLESKLKTSPSNERKWLELKNWTKRIDMEIFRVSDYEYYDVVFPLALLLWLRRDWSVKTRISARFRFKLEIFMSMNSFSPSPYLLSWMKLRLEEWIWMDIENRTKYIEIRISWVTDFETDPFEISKFDIDWK